MDRGFTDLVSSSQCIQAHALSRSCSTASRSIASFGLTMRRPSDFARASPAFYLSLICDRSSSGIISMRGNLLVSKLTAFSTAFFLGGRRRPRQCPGAYGRLNPTNGRPTVDRRLIGHQLCDSCLLPPVIKRFDAAKVKNLKNFDCADTSVNLGLSIAPNPDVSYLFLLWCHLCRPVCFFIFNFGT